jgi:hypothetical protein
MASPLLAQRVAEYYTEVAYFKILSISRLVICNLGLDMAARLGGPKRLWKHGTERG